LPFNNHAAACATTTSNFTTDIYDEVELQETPLPETNNGSGSLSSSSPTNPCEFFHPASPSYHQGILIDADTGAADISNSLDFDCHVSSRKQDGDRVLGEDTLALFKPNKDSETGDDSGTDTAGGDYPLRRTDSLSLFQPQPLPRLGKDAAVAGRQGTLPTPEAAGQDITFTTGPSHIMDQERSFNEQFDAMDIWQRPERGGATFDPATVTEFENITGLHAATVRNASDSSTTRGRGRDSARGSTRRSLSPGRATHPSSSTSNTFQPFGNTETAGIQICGPTSVVQKTKARKRASTESVAEATAAKQQRLRADDLKSHWLRQQTFGDEYEETLSIVEEFILPDGKWAQGRRACDAVLGKAESLLISYRRSGTWKRYVPSLRAAKVMLHRWLKDDKHHYPQHAAFWGLNARTLRLPEAKDYMVAVVCAKFFENRAATGVDVMSHAISMMCTVNNIPVPSDFRTKVVKEACRRLRRKSVRKMAGLSFSHVELINADWGAHDQPGKRMISLAVCLAFVALLRFSDLAVINIGGIYFAECGVLICVPVRKNGQVYPSWITVADTGSATGVVARLKDMIKFLGHVVPKIGFIDCREFLFRDVTLGSGHTHEHRRVDTIDNRGGGVRSLSKNAYNHYLSRFRSAMRACCGLTKAEANMFGLHSMRSGGDTHLFNKGFSKQSRMAVGGWATELVEQGYLRLRSKELFDLTREAGL
jgi:hypothetical protein